RHWRLRTWKRNKEIPLNARESSISEFVQRQASPASSPRKKGNDAYLVEGEKITRYGLLEKALKENKHISQLIFTKAQPLNHALK
ncbi:MAG: hypothetical protein ACP5IE_04100, partial [Infirmifilum sp.]